MILIAVGYLRQEFLLLWEFPIQFSFVDRLENVAVERINLKSQILSLLLYILIYYCGNSLMISILLEDKLWWIRVFIFYISVILAGAFFIVVDNYTETNLPERAAQLLKEAILSPLPFLLIIPYIFWKKSNV